MFVDSRLAPSPDAPASAPAMPAAGAAGGCPCHVLQLLPGTALCEAEVVRQLAREGLAVLRRSWGPAREAGGAPTLLLLTAPAPEALAERAAERLRQRTGATVRRLHADGGQLRA